MTRKECGRKRCPPFWDHSDFFLEELRKTMKTVRIVDVPIDAE
jgi:hypothetical protein